MNQIFNVNLDLDNSNNKEKPKINKLVEQVEQVLDGVNNSNTETVLALSIIAHVAVSYMNSD